MVFATIPVPIYVTLVLWIDRYESEPLWLLATAFCWGALVAVFIAFIFNTAGFVAVAVMTNSQRAGQTASAVIFAPIVEESAKALILFIIFFWKKDEFDGVIDGIVYAALVALGFAMTENIQYYGKAALQGGGAGLTLIFIIRGAFAPFSHPLFTSMTGIGLGLARQSTNMAVKFITPVLGLIDGDGHAQYLEWFGSRRRWRGIHSHLSRHHGAGVSHSVSRNYLFTAPRGAPRARVSLPGLSTRPASINRSTNSFAALLSAPGLPSTRLSRGGMARWRDCKQFNQMGSELAFHRSRVARGIYKSEQAAREREAAYLQTLQEILSRLRAGKKRAEISADCDGVDVFMAYTMLGRAR